MAQTQSDRPVVVITGATAGVGRAVAQRFARDGARIGLIARGMDRLEATKREVEQLGGKALICQCDVADAEAVDEAASKVEEHFGPIDIWINVAFAGMMAPFIDISMAEFKRVTEVTYLGQIHGIHAALKRMIPRDRGSIVITGSALAYRGIPLQSPYCGSKHALQGFQDSLRCELLHMKSNVTVTMVQLPGVNTPEFDWMRTTMPMTLKPASPPYQPEVAADAIHFAAYSKRKEVIFGWWALVAVWADKLASPLVDRYLAKTGFASQQTDQPIPPGRKDNLYEPAPGNPGAHGRFDAMSHGKSRELWLTKHRGQAALGAALALAAGGLAWLGSRRTA
jgi:NAD(P)-dependent dehydrogenase (short-subunit alcohol dehydrogenase family)